MSKPLRLLVYGLVTWLVPFVAAFAFYTEQGELRTSPGLFKCVMIVVGGLTSCWLLYKYFAVVRSDFAREGWIVGLTWLAMNIILDLLVLIPMSGMTMKHYFLTIGLGYLIIPIICVTAGMLLARRNSSPT